jgi:hypothetical protein
LTPASDGFFQIWTLIRRKLEKLEKHKRRIFSNDGWTNFWDFPGIIFPELIFCGRTLYHMHCQQYLHCNTLLSQLKKNHTHTTPRGLALKPELLESKNSIFLTPHRIHLNWFCHLNKFSSPCFGDCTYSYVLIQSDIRYKYVLIRSTYVLYDNTIYVHTL